MVLLLLNSLGSLSVSAWAVALSNYYQSNSPTYILDDRISRVRWYKNIQGLEHEFLIATISHLEAGRKTTGHLRIERNAMASSSQKAPAVAVLALCQRPSQCKNHSESTLSPAQPMKSRWSIMGNLGHAEDTVTFAEDETSLLSSPSLLLCEYALPPSHPIYALKFAIIVGSVHEMQPDYTLFANQCYWFARTICRVIAQTCKPTLAPTIHMRIEGTYDLRRTKGAKVALIKGKRTFSRIAVTSKDNAEASVDALCERLAHLSSSFHSSRPS